MKVRNNLKDVVLMAQLAQSLIDGVPEEMKRIVDVAANWERETHEYVNRSGNLEASTRGVVTTRSQRVSSVSLVMGRTPDAPYASYIVAMGKSNIEMAAHMAEEELVKYFEGLFRRPAMRRAA